MASGSIRRGRARIYAINTTLWWQSDVSQQRWILSKRSRLKAASVADRISYGAPAESRCLPINGCRKFLNGIAAALLPRHLVRHGCATTHKESIIRCRIDPSVVFLDGEPAVNVFDAFRLAGDGYRPVDGFLCVSSSMQPHYAIGISINVYITHARNVLGREL